MLKLFLRRLILSFLWFCARLRSRPWPTPASGPVLVIAPHPDDAALGCGGQILHWQERGLDVHIACLTDGAASHPGDPAWTPERLRRIRRAEETAAAGLLGVPIERLHFLDWPDGELERLAEQENAVAMLRALVRRIGPGLVLVTSLQEASSEHRAACRLLHKALAGEPSSPLVGGYLVWSLWSPQAFIRVLRGRSCLHHLAIPGKHRPVRRSAIRAHASQTAAASMPRGFFSAFDRPEELWLTDLPPRP